VLEDRIALRAGAAKCLISRITKKDGKPPVPVKIYSEQELIIRSSTAAL
jgi:DNA-binding LacI/PurR family transcriptional regulator